MALLLLRWGIVLGLLWLTLSDAISDR